MRDFVHISPVRVSGVHVNAIDDQPNENEEAVDDSGSDSETEEAEIDQQSTEDEDDYFSFDADEPQSSVNGAGDDSYFVGRDGTRWQTAPFEILSRRRLTTDIVRESNKVTANTLILLRFLLCSSLFLQQRWKI